MITLMLIQDMVQWCTVTHTAKAWS